MNNRNTASLPGKLQAIDWFLLTVSLLLLYYVILVMLNGRINVDEIEHLHSAWYIKNGYVPFKDFFQHHNPFFWYLLVPLPGLRTENPEVIIQARGLMTLFTILSAIVAALSAVKLGGSRTHGLLTFIIILSVSFYVVKSTNVRPDGLGTLLSIVSFYFFLGAVEGKRTSIILTAAFIALAFMVSQKAVFIYAFYGLYFATSAYRREISIRLYFLFIAILFSPFVLAMAYGLAIGGLAEYLFSNYVLNIIKKSISGTYTDLLQIFKDNWFFWAVSAAGFAYSLLKRRANPKVFLSFLLGSIVLIAALSSSCHPQYYLPVIPLFALASSLILLEVIELTGKGQSVLIVLVVSAYLYTPVTNFKHVKDNENHEKIAMIGDLTASIPKEGCVYDEQRAFNIFRRDAHYLWYNPALRKQYIHATGRYTAFNRCQIIRDSEPVIVDGRGFRFSKCAVYNSYKETKHDGFYILK